MTELLSSGQRCSLRLSRLQLSRLAAVARLRRQLALSRLRRARRPPAELESRKSKIESKNSEAQVVQRTKEAKQKEYYMYQHCQQKDPLGHGIITWKRCFGMMGKRSSKSSRYGTKILCI